MGTMGRSLCAAAALAASVLVCGPAASPARAQDKPKPVSDLERELVDDAPAVRAAAAATLAGRFPDGAVAVPMLVDLLDDESPDVAAAAAASLESLAVSAVPPLAAYCSDVKRFDPKTRTGKALLVLLGLASPTARDVLVPRGEDRKADDPGRCVIAAVHGIGHDGTETDAVAELLAAARGTNSSVAMHAAAALATYGGDAAPPRTAPGPAHPQRTSALTAAGKLLAGKTDVESWIGARLLARLRPGDPETCTALLAAIDAVRTKPKLYPGVPAPTANACVTAIGSMGAAAEPAVPRLLAAARGEDPNVDLDRAVRALLRLGKTAELRTLLAGRPPEAAYIATLMAQGGIRTNEVCAAMIDAKRVDYDVLAACGAAAAPVLPRLRSRLAEIRKSKGPCFESIGCASAILALDRSDQEAAAHLGNVSADAKLEEFLRADALRGLARVLPESPDVVDDAGPRLERALGGDLADLSLLADWLSRRAAPARQAVPDLLKLAAIADANAAKSPSDAVTAAQQRRTIAGALGRIGARAAAAIPLLERWRDKADESTRARIARELRRVRAAK